jgi:rubredoxin
MEMGSMGIRRWKMENEFKDMMGRKIKAGDEGFTILNGRRRDGAVLALRYDGQILFKVHGSRIPLIIRPYLFRKVDVLWSCVECEKAHIPESQVWRCPDCGSVFCRKCGDPGWDDLSGTWTCPACDVRMDAQPKEEEA